jgi:hypothetical protein
MALHWSVEDIADSDRVCFEERDPLPSEGKPGEKVRALRPLTEALIFATLGVKIGHITESNASEFYARLKVTERLDGPLLYKTDDEGNQIDVAVTPEMIRAHVGLRTNVPTEKRAAFLAGIRADLDRRMREYEHDAQQAATA